MNILVTNDDGLDAQGIHELVEDLALIGGVDIYVFAPDSQRSCVGHSVTVRSEVYVEELAQHDFPEAKRVFISTGTPADCSKLALSILEKEGVKTDLVCCGINHGSNIGTDVFYSGTCAAAIEAVLCGVPSIAFSVCTHQPRDFGIFRRLVPQIVKAAAGRIPENCVVNVNVPDLPEEKIRGVKIKYQGPREYDDDYLVTRRTEKGMYLAYTGGYVFYDDPDPDWDVGASQDGYIAIVPLSPRLSRSGDVAKFEKIFAGLEA